MKGWAATVVAARFVIRASPDRKERRSRPEGVGVMSMEKLLLMMEKAGRFSPPSSGFRPGQFPCTNFQCVKCRVLLAFARAEKT